MKYKTRFFLFFIAMSLFHLSANFVHPVTPTLIKNLNQPEYMFGLMFAMMTITNFALSPFWGKINLYISSRLSLLICCVSYALCQLGFAYSVNQLQLLTVRALAGIFIGGINVSLLTYVVNDAKPEDQGKYLIYTATNQSVLAAFGYLVGSRYLVTAVKNGTLRFPAGAEGTVSVFCLGADARGVDLEGLYYPLKDGVLTAGFPLGVSNHFTGAEAKISVEKGSLLVMWDRENGLPERG